MRRRKQRERTVTVNEACKSKENCVCMGIIPRHIVGQAELMKAFLSAAHFLSVPLRGTAGPVGTEAPEVNCPISRSTARLHGDSPSDIIGGEGW